jgi:hypothetical protein
MLKSFLTTSFICMLSTQSMASLYVHRLLHALAELTVEVAHIRCLHIKEEMVCHCPCHDCMPISATHPQTVHAMTCALPSTGLQQQDLRFSSQPHHVDIAKKWAKETCEAYGNFALR